MAIIRPKAKSLARGSGCKWCAQGQCWTHGGAKGGAKGGARPVFKTFAKKGKGGGSKGAGCKWCAQGQCWTHGGKKGGGKSSGGKGGGQWLFVPDAMGSKFGKGKGKGKGMGKKTEQWNKSMDKLNKIEADQKVWVGGLSKDVTWKKLEKHFEESGGIKPKVTEIMSKGTACCAFKTAEEAQSAIAAVNGSELEGKDIEVDVWAAKEKKPREDKPKRKFGAAFVKTGKKESGKFDKTVDHSLKVWVGGLAEKTTPAKLMKHFAENSCEAEGASSMKTGTACVTFKTDDAASSAVGVMNATELDGKTIEVDVWTKPEKKEKKVKKEE